MEKGDAGGFGQDAFLHHALWIVPLFQHFRGLGKFQAFLKAHRLPESPQMLRGLNLLIYRLMAQHVQTFEREDVFGIKSDMMTDRALFCGVPAEKVPPTSERALVVRNLGGHLEAVYVAKSFSGLDAALEKFAKEMVEPLETVFETQVEFSPKLVPGSNKHDVLKAFGEFFLWNEGHDLDRFLPSRAQEFFGETIREADPQKRDLKTEYHYPGYQLGLAFLWHELLGKENELVTRILAAKSWPELDELSQFVKKNVIEAEECRLGISSTVFEVFRFVGPPDKTSFRALLAKGPAQDFSVHERLGQLFYWYQFDLMDSGRSKIFTGGSAFVSLLRGEIEERGLHGVKEKLNVIRFIHPGGSKSFSYALLIERFGSFSDFSGWLVFMDVGGDYVGLGGTEYANVEAALKQLSSKVSLKTMEVTNEELRRYFQTEVKRRSSDFHYEADGTAGLQFQISELRRLRSHALGLMLEFIVRSYFEEQDWSLTVLKLKDPEIFPDGHEVDVVAFKERTGELVVAECSMNLPINNVQAILGEIAMKSRKVQADSRFSSAKTCTKLFVTSRQTLGGIRGVSKIRKSFEEAGVRLVSVEDDLIPKLPKKFNKPGLVELFGKEKPVPWDEVGLVGPGQHEVDGES